MVIKSNLPEIKIPVKAFHDFVFDEWHKFKDNIAAIDNDLKEQLTFQQLMDQSKFIAKALLNLGVEKSEVVCLVMDWSPTAIYITLGVSLAGAAFQIVSPKLREWEMQFPVIESETRFIFADEHGIKEISKLMASLNRDHRIICTGGRDNALGFPIISDLSHSASQDCLLPEIDPEFDVVYLPHSSGIHGKRKGILTTHHVMVAKTMVMWNPSEHKEFNEGEITVAMMPLHKQMGLDSVFCSLLSGMTVVTQRNFCVHTLMTCLQKYKVRTIYCSPFMMNMMIFETQNHEYTIENLETIITGADAVTEELHDEFLAKFPSVKMIVQTYGMTEVGLISRTYDSKFVNSCGQLAANLELKIIDILTGTELGPNEKGQIFVKGLAASSPYLNNPEATAEHFIEGWRKTGDIGYYDQNENIHIVDKLKEMIKVFGFQVVPKEIETLLLTHHSVEESAVVAINNEISGERPVAFVVLKEDHTATEEELKDYVNRRVIRYKHLVAVHIVKILPKSPCGTVLRRLLAEAAVLSVAEIGEIEKEMVQSTTKRKRTDSASTIA
ncbi:unnamed protein product [Caenorhabditis bovis]|uniref:AMP-dependent synthetase/ligase domain-containing protein n=1 Tax=Caenorhabditis bovis TaxID=2654633 RepID=A0A8S1EE53_9PELO|nr:unnamed protein product [Caenorhabditis bovis]